MSERKFNNNDELTGDFYLNETIGPEHYRRFMDEQIKKKQAQQQQYGMPKSINRSNLPLFSDDEDIPAYSLGNESYGNDYSADYAGGYADSGYNGRYGDVYINQQYQPQYQQPQYQQPQYPQYEEPQYQPPQYPQYEEPQYQKPKKKKKKKHRLLKALIFTPIVLILTVLIGVMALGYGILSKIDYNQVDLEENAYIDSSELHSSEDVTNILFVGVDDDENGNSRSDSMMLISIDKKHEKIKLTSFLRDSWVDLPMKGRKGKLNAAYAADGIQGAVDTIEYNFLIDIDHYVKVDFEMFTQIIDAVGGVEVEVTEKEAAFIRKTTRFKEMQSGEKVRLNGAEALVYCRIRKLDTDYMRTYRQRKVISALMAKAKEADIKKLTDVMFDVFPLIQTDLNKRELVTTGVKGAYGLLKYEVQQTRAPIQEHMKETTINGQWVEELELEKVREYLYDYIYTDKIKFDDDKNDNKDAKKDD